MSTDDLPSDPDPHAIYVSDCGHVMLLRTTGWQYVWSWRNFRTMRRKINWWCDLDDSRYDLHTTHWKATKDTP